MKTVVQDLKCSAKQVLSLFLATDHIRVNNPGLNTWLDLPNAVVEVLPDQIIQRFPFNPYKDKRGAYAAYLRAWRLFKGHDPVFGAERKLSFKSGRMYERYPGVSVLSTVFDSDFEHEDGGCIKTTSFSAAIGVPDFVVEEAIKAYVETADQNKIALESLALDALMGRDSNLYMDGGVSHYLRYLEENK